MPLVRQRFTQHYVDQSPGETESTTSTDSKGSATNNNGTSTRTELDPAQESSGRRFLKSLQKQQPVPKISPTKRKRLKTTKTDTTVVVIDEDTAAASNKPNSQSKSLEATKADTTVVATAKDTAAAILPANPPKPKSLEVTKADTTVVTIAKATAVASNTNDPIIPASTTATITSTPPITKLLKADSKILDIAKAAATNASTSKATNLERVPTITAATATANFTKSLQSSKEPITKLSKADSTILNIAKAAVTNASSSKTINLSRKALNDDELVMSLRERCPINKTPVGVGQSMPNRGVFVPPASFVPPPPATASVKVAPPANLVVHSSNTQSQQHQKPPQQQKPQSPKQTREKPKQPNQQQQQAQMPQQQQQQQQQQQHGTLEKLAQIFLQPEAKQPSEVHKQRDRQPPPKPQKKIQQTQQKPKAQPQMQSQVQQSLAVPQVQQLQQVLQLSPQMQQGPLSPQIQPVQQVVLVPTTFPPQPQPQQQQQWQPVWPNIHQPAIKHQQQLLKPKTKHTEIIIDDSKKKPVAEERPKPMQQKQQLHQQNQQRTIQKSQETNQIIEDSKKESPVLERIKQKQQREQTTATQHQSPRNTQKRPPPQQIQPSLAFQKRQRQSQIIENSNSNGRSSGVMMDRIQQAMETKEATKDKPLQTPKQQQQQTCQKQQQSIPQHEKEQQQQNLQNEDSKKPATKEQQTQPQQDALQQVQKQQSQIEDAKPAARNQSLQPKHTTPKQQLLQNFIQEKRRRQNHEEEEIENAKSTVSNEPLKEQQNQNQPPPNTQQEQLSTQQKTPKKPTGRDEGVKHEQKAQQQQILRQKQKEPHQLQIEDSKPPARNQPQQQQSQIEDSKILIPLLNPSLKRLNQQQKDQIYQQVQLVIQQQVKQQIQQQVEQQVQQRVEQYIQQQVQHQNDVSTNQDGSSEMDVESSDDEINSLSSEEDILDYKSDPYFMSLEMMIMKNRHKTEQLEASSRQKLAHLEREAKLMNLQKDRRRNILMKKSRRLLLKKSRRSRASQIRINHNQPESSPSPTPVAKTTQKRKDPPPPPEVSLPAAADVAHPPKKKTRSSERIHVAAPPKWATRSSPKASSTQEVINIDDESSSGSETSSSSDDDLRDKQPNHNSSKPLATQNGSAITNSPSNSPTYPLRKNKTFSPPRIPKPLLKEGIQMNKPRNGPFSRILSESFADDNPKSTTHPPKENASSERDAKIKAKARAFALSGIPAKQLRESKKVAKKDAIVREIPLSSIKAEARAFALSGIPAKQFHRESREDVVVKEMPLSSKNTTQPPKTATAQTKPTKNDAIGVARRAPRVDKARGRRRVVVPSSLSQLKVEGLLQLLHQNGKLHPTSLELDGTFSGWKLEFPIVDHTNRSAYLAALELAFMVATKTEIKVLVNYSVAQDELQMVAADIARKAVDKMCQIEKKLTGKKSLDHSTFVLGLGKRVFDFKVLIGGKKSNLSLAKCIEKMLKNPEVVEL